MSSSKSSQDSSTNYADSRRVLGEGSLSAEGSAVNYSQTIHNTSVDGRIAGDALDSMRQTATGAVNAQAGVVADALGGGFDFGARALSANGNAVSDALGFGGDALGAVQRAAASALDFGSDALSGAYGFGLSAMNHAADANADALGFTESTLGKILEFGGDTADRSQDSLAFSANLVKDAYADAKGRGAMTDKILIGAVICAGIVAALAVYRK